MATFLAIFSILSGTASILGLVHVLKGETEIEFKNITIGAFLLAGAVSLYILFIPGTYFENSVSSKLQRYSKEGAESILIQQGDFSFDGMKEYAVKFPEPFSKTPLVEIINVNGYKYAPYVERVTQFQVVFKRSSDGPSWTPQSFQNFIWIAKGDPLNKYVAAGSNK
ncbi:hypothetical protein [Pseudoalteromonas xiamenensis]|uniref:Uncharacterized protein n=1 Tax=Pseudoalteromonas xiamenensis TaxID=882626 RepID=A0A975DH71_9GAMM|nr:hypothetical protein [Pseudoalteromonas xiamenensis]QTH71135.1 hypothetical protein J5O05_15135 [Pseudoalteromonas xiamenensis]